MSDADQHLDDDRLIKAHADLVYATCLRVTGNAQDATDVSQEVFIAWIRDRQRIRGPLAAWLHATARRRSLDWLRRHHRRQHHELAAAGEATRPATADASDDDWQRVLDNCLAQLDARSRTLVIEHHVLGLDQGRLAERWRISQATVSRHLDTALTRLRKALARHGITATSLSVLPAGLARLHVHTHCPTELSAPLLAQAQVAGGAALVAGGVLAPWWSWPMVAAIATTVMTLVIGGALGWRAVIAMNLPGDPVGEALAQLPPAPAVVVTPPSTGAPRYRSIEELIARLPPVDEARQERIRKWLTQDGASRPWKWLTAPSTMKFQIALDPDRCITVTPEDRLRYQRLLQECEALWPELASDDATLTEAGWVARDYREGRYTDLNAIIIQTPVPHLLAVRDIVHALRMRMINAQAFEPDLARLDYFCASLRHGTVYLITAMASMAADTMRDDWYLTLTIQNRLSEAALRRWCQERCVATNATSDAYRGEMLTFQLVMLEDGLHDGVWQLFRRTVDNPPLRAPGILDWLARPAFTRDMMQAASYTSRISASLSGQGSAHAICQEWEHAPKGYFTPFTFLPNLAESAQTAAQARLAHAGKRMTAWLIHRSRSGIPLPESLDEVIGILADGPSLLHGGAMTYGLRYTRLNDTRFRLELDAAGPSPTYAVPDRVNDLIKWNRPTQVKPGSFPPPIDMKNLAWEADTARLPTASSPVPPAPIPPSPPVTTMPEPPPAPVEPPSPNARQ